MDAGQHGARFSASGSRPLRMSACRLSVRPVDFSGLSYLFSSVSGAVGPFMVWAVEDEV